MCPRINLSSFSRCELGTRMLKVKTRWPNANQYDTEYVLFTFFVTIQNHLSEFSCFKWSCRVQSLPSFRAPRPCSVLKLLHTQREMFYFTVVFKMKKNICLIPVFFFILLWIIKLRVNNIWFSLRLRQITQTQVVIFHDIDHAEFKDCLVCV